MMQATDELARARSSESTAVTIGTFDGVHLGHQHLIRALRKKASAEKLLAAIVTFAQRPGNVLFPDRSTPYLTTLTERLRLLRTQEVDIIVPITFDQDLSQLTAREFVALLQSELKMQALVIGPNFTMGKQRQGDLSYLQNLGEEMGFGVSTVDALSSTGEVVSSTTIRNALINGRIETVRSGLGRPFTLTGTVIRGHQRGRELGFPTANLNLPIEQAMPADGVYLTWALIDEIRYPSLSNVGDNPTFQDKERAVEVFIFDFDQDIYGHSMTIEIVSRLREEIRFSSAQALIDQMYQDVSDAKKVFEQHL